MIKLTFNNDCMPPSLNGSNGLLRMHWTRRKQIKEQFMWMIKAQKFIPIKGQVVMRMTGYYCGLPMDWDNFASKMKIINDVMVDLKLLEDDSPKIIVYPVLKQLRVKTKKDVRLEFIYESHYPSE